MVGFSQSTFSTIFQILLCSRGFFALKWGQKKIKNQQNKAKNPSQTKIKTKPNNTQNNNNNKTPKKAKTNKQGKTPPKPKGTKTVLEMSDSSWRDYLECSKMSIWRPHPNLGEFQIAPRVTNFQLRLGGALIIWWKILNIVFSRCEFHTGHLKLCSPSSHSSATSKMETVNFWALCWFVPRTQHSLNMFPLAVYVQ